MKNNRRSAFLLLCILVLGPAALVLGNEALTLLRAGQLTPTVEPQSKQTRPVSIPRGITSDNRPEELAATEKFSIPITKSTITATIEQWSPSARRHDPAAAFKVYEAEALCAKADHLTSVAKRLGKSGFNSEAQINAALTSSAEIKANCEGVSEAQKAERVYFLEEAARGGVPGAAVAYYKEGPPTGRPTSPLAVEDKAFLDWRDKAISYLKAAVVSGDSDAITTLASAYDNNGYVNDPEQALKYAAAEVTLRKGNLDTSSYIIRLKNNVSSTLAAESAIADGKTLALRNS